MPRTGPTNITLRTLTRELRKTANQYKAPIWDYVADILERPSRSRVVVNVSKLERVASPNEVVVIPGKLLGAGTINKRVVVVAFSFSPKAVEKVKNAGGQVMSIKDLISINPSGSGVKVVI
ncbi:MAG: 50S ribosomal protein L18e [Zestosphaera sp.]